MVGVREDALRASVFHQVRQQPLIVPCVPTGMNAGVSKCPWRGDATQARRTGRIGLETLVAKRSVHRKRRVVTGFSEIR